MENWKDILVNFINILEIKAPGYLLFQKIILFLTDSYQFYLILIAFIFNIILGFFILKKSPNFMFSFLIYLCLFYEFYGITGIRQTLATAFIVIIGYKFIKEKKVLPFVLLSIVSFTIHKSIIFFFPFYFFANMKIKSFKFLLVCISFLLVFVFINFKIFLPIANLLKYEYTLFFDIKGTETYFLFLCLVLLVFIFRYKDFVNIDSENLIFFNAILIGWFFTLLTFRSQSFMRIQQYYTTYLIVALPRLFETFKEREKKLLLLISITILLILFLKNEPYYRFFWQ